MQATAADTRPCPKCFKDVSIHATLCGHCWTDITKLADPREQWTRQEQVHRHRTLTAVVLVSAIVLTLFFVGMQRFLTKHVAAEVALQSSPHPAVHAVHPPASPVPAPTVDEHGVLVEASTDAAPAASEPPEKVKRQRPALDPADPMVVAEDETQLSASAAQLQTVYIAIVCSCFAMVAALVAFARAWR